MEVHVKTYTHAHTWGPLPDSLSLPHTQTHIDTVDTSIFGTLSRMLLTKSRFSLRFNLPKRNMAVDETGSFHNTK